MLALVQARSGQLAVAQFSVRAAGARRIDAGAIPNPELAATVEDFGGVRDRGGFRGSQTTLQISQAIPIGGRLRSQRDVAREEEALAEAEYQGRRLELFAEATKTFIRLVAAQERETLIRTDQQYADRLNTILNAPGTLPVDQNVALSAIAAARLRAQQTAIEVSTLRRQLASYWAADAGSVGRVVGNLTRLPVLPPVSTLLGRLERNPDLARAASEHRVRSSALALEKAKAIPDLTVNGGVRRYGDDGTHGFVGGVSIPLPLFGRNQGAIEEARIRQAQAQTNIAVAQQRAATAVQATYDQLRSAANESAVLQRSLIPAAQRNAQTTREAFQAGKGKLVDLVTAERAVIELQLRLLAVLATYHELFADLEVLVGGLPGVSTPIGGAT